MSCDTLDTQSVRMATAVGALPEGFCPSSMQELADAIAQRLIVTPSSNFNGIAVGSTEPQSNVGPWLKDCLEWWVFDDSTASYRPIEKDGFNAFTVHEASGTYIVPADIYRIMVEGWGAGGGGANTAGGSAGPGGGGGGFGVIIRDVVPGQVINYTVGLAGTAGVTGTNGGSTTILGMVVGGGEGGLAPTAPSPDPGGGGVVVGADLANNGGGGKKASGDGGDGGDSPRGGQGGVADVSGGTNQNATAPGGGGAGGTVSNANGGNGAGGRIVIWY